MSSIRCAGAVLCYLSLCLLGCSDSGDEAPPLTPVNRPPVLATQSDTLAAVGDTLHLQAIATDPDGDILRYGVLADQTLEEIRGGYLVSAGIDTLMGSFWFAPKVEDRPSRHFRFHVHDHREGRDTTEFDVTVM